MNQTLIDKIRRARETNVTVEGKTFTVRRPTYLEMLEFFQQKLPLLEKPSADDDQLLAVYNFKIMKELVFAGNYIVDWQDVTELDLFSGGTGAVVAFDIDLFRVWLADKTERYWAPLGEAIINSYTAHQASLDDTQKKPDAG